MSSQHTLGPWATNTTDQGMSNTGGVYVTVTDGNMVTICHVLCTDFVGRGAYLPYDANARLIAAAPDMLEALEAAQESIATFIGVHKYPMDSGAGDILRLVDAAIAKAKGHE